VSSNGHRRDVVAGTGHRDDPCLVSAVRRRNRPAFKARLTGLLALILCLASSLALGQGGYNDDRVMIQGFMWESHEQGTCQGAGGYEYTVDWKYKWYKHVKDQINELADAKFNLIWLPPPSQGNDTGYHPEQYYNFSNCYGSETEQRELLQALLKAGIEPVADVVINHRNGSGGWATFKSPDWPASYICSTDEFWSKDPNDVAEEDRPILAKGEKGAADYSGAYSGWSGARDLDHTNLFLREDIKTYLRKLKGLGYRGWRYDMVKGYDPKYVAEYNYASQPTFAVGEYWDTSANTLTWWVDQTKWQGQADPAQKACSAFDFALQDQLRDLIDSGQYDYLPALTYQDNVRDGLVAINRNKAVTFLENHDTGFPQKQFDSFSNNDKLMQGYAFILTHPGLPCVYWKHYFDWNRGPEIKKLIRARKCAGVHSGSYIKTEPHGGDYIAVVGDQPSDSSTLIVKIGPGLSFNPDSSVWTLETSGPGYAVWVRTSKKLQTQDKVEASLSALEIPGQP
jgi:alpha-amylase